MAIIEYDRRPDATVDEKLTSLVESVMRALDEIDGHPVSSSSDSESIGKGRSEISPEDGAFKIYDASGTVIASFGEQAQVGVGTESHSVIDANGQRFYATDGTTLLANIGYGEGNTEDGTATAPYYTFGTRAMATEVYSTSKSYKVGDIVLYPDEYGEAFVCRKDTSGTWDSLRWQKLIGAFSHTNGRVLVASGSTSQAEGLRSKAIGNDSHAEGSQTIALGYASHAEGFKTIAREEYSHAGGYKSEASGDYSFAHGLGVVANGQGSVAFGKYNKTNYPYLFSVGCGTDENHRDNAFALDEYGHAFFKDGAEFGGDLFVIGDFQVDGTFRGTLEGPEDVNVSIANGCNAVVERAQCVQFGQLVMFLLVFRNSTTIAPQANVFDGTLLTSKFWPALSSRGVTYWRQSSLIMSISTEGGIVVRNASSSNVQCSTNTWISSLYLIT